jgi:hypothetical protein
VSSLVGYKFNQLVTVEKETQNMRLHLPLVTAIPIVRIFLLNSTFRLARQAPIVNSNLSRDTVLTLLGCL